MLESRLAELLKGQAKKFIRGFNAEQLNLGILSGSLELKNLALNPEPFDELLLGSELPFIVKAGTLSSALLQLSLMQGELELVVDGLSLVLAPACRWLTRQEVWQHRTNEMERLEFVHMRSQNQRRALERDMFKKLFADYLSRIKITVKNVHFRVEIEEELSSSLRGDPVAVGLVIASCDVLPVPSVLEGTKTEDSRDSEFLLAEQIGIKGFSLYHEPLGSADVHISWKLFQATKSSELGPFQKLPQAEFSRLMTSSRQRHANTPAPKQLMPPTNISTRVDLKAQSLSTDCHVENCLTMEVVVRLENPSKLRFTASIIEGFRWLVRRTVYFQMWPFLHAQNKKPVNARSRWHAIRCFLALKRRIQSSHYSLQDAILMRSNCKEYIRLYKRKFNGPESSVAWRKSLQPLSPQDATDLGLIELSYPADKLVNFRLMAHAEMKTESSINSFGVDEGVAPSSQRSPRRQIYGQVRELTPLEQLHLHGQHGLGVNIYRGLPPPPSNLKIRIDMVAPHGLWWVCELDAGEKAGSKSRSVASNWAVALDCAKQPLHLLLVDSIADTSVFATLEVPRAAPGERPLALLLGRSEAAFLPGSPGRDARRTGASAGSGGRGAEEWCSVLEFDGHVCSWGQLKTVPMSACHSPWDMFLHFSCGHVVDQKLRDADTTFARTSSLSELLGKPSLRIMQGGRPGEGSGEEESCIRLNLPLQLATGQEGPFADFLRWCVAPLQHGEPPRNSPIAVHQSERSGLAWLAALVGRACEIAALRTHVMLPPIFLGGVNSADAPMRLPRFDAACHIEHGGLIDGFVVGLHNLRHFTTLLVSMQAAGEQPQQVKPTPRSSSSFVPPVSLKPLEQAPCVSLTLGALLAALAVVLAGGRKKGPASDAPADQGNSPQGTALLDLARQRGLSGIARVDDSSKPAADDPLAAVTLSLMLLAVVAGRRALWDELRQNAGGLTPGPVIFSGSGVAKTSVTEVFNFFGAALQVLLAMGFPLHRCCLPLAAWVGSVELLQVMVQASSTAKGTGVGMSNLVSWAARGSYANPLPRQSQVIGYLLSSKASLDHRDAGGRSVLDWACWAGCEDLVASLLRRGLLQNSDAAPQDAVQPLIMAMSSRSASVVSMLLRAAGDPHAAPRSEGNSGGSYACGPLLLAVRCCEYELACEVLRSSASLTVDMALGVPSPPRRDRGGNTSSPSRNEGDGAASAGSAYVTRATVVLVESLRRFASALGRRNAEEVAAAAMRAHVPGPHPDEGLYASSHMPLGDVLHPLLAEMSPPTHKVLPEQRPGIPSLQWMRRNSHDDPWGPARLMVECLLERGFHPDESFLAKVMPALPQEVQALSRRLLQGCDASGRRGNTSPKPLPTLLSDIIPEIRSSAIGADKPPTAGWYGLQLQERTATAGDGDGGFLPAKEIRQAYPRPLSADEASLSSNAAYAYMQGGPWNSDRLRAELRAEEASSLPALRIVVLGAPRVGKTTVARVLAEHLGIEQVEEDDGPSWLRVASGTWQSSGNLPRVQAFLWDTSCAVLGLPMLDADQDVATVVVTVVDAAEASSGSGLDLPAESWAPRRALVVENSFDALGPNTFSHANGQSKGSSLPTVRCNVLDQAGCDSLRAAFGHVLAEILGQMEARAEAPPALPLPSQFAHFGQGDFRSVLARDVSLSSCGAPRKPLGERALASRLPGDSALIDPSAASWAWAALWASRSTLQGGEASGTNGLTGTSPSSSSASSAGSGKRAVASWDRLESILSSAGGGDSKASVTLLSALVDLGLVCPIPSSGRARTMLCATALIPDFAPRVRISKAVAKRLLEHSSGGASPRAFVRLLWEGKGSRKPRLRSVLRDLLAQSALGSEEARGAKRLKFHYFALIEARAAGSALPAAGSSDLTPGFILAFDLESPATESSEVGTESAPNCPAVATPRKYGSPSSGSPLPPEGTPSTPSRRAASEELEGADAGLTALVTSSSMTHLTFVVVRASHGARQQSGAPFWDVLCTGPHAQWAWHALLGAGSRGPTFAGFRRCQGEGDGDSSWPFPAPAHVLSAAPLSGSPTKAARGSNSDELASLAWLFAGPQSAESARALLATTLAEETGSAGGFAACCAALCGKSRPSSSMKSFMFAGGLACCTEFEACLLLRSWADAPRLLEEALSEGAEAWELCAAVLARFARDTAGSAAGERGKALPLLRATDLGNAACAELTLISEGPRLLVDGQAVMAEPSPLLTGSNARGAGIEAWLCICQPAALWEAAGVARRFSPASDSAAGKSADSRVGAKVVGALQAALATSFSEAMVSEVWQALEQSTSEQLLRRPGGAWLQAGGEKQSLIL